MGAHEFDVALSFASEDREYVAQVASGLVNSGVTVFYDQFSEAELWGANLYDHLSDVYGKKARYCILFVSAAYAKKAWTNHERKAAQARALREHEIYVLPARFDDSEISGLETVAYVDLRVKTPTDLVKLVLLKLGSQAIASPRETAIVTPHPHSGRLRHQIDELTGSFESLLLVARRDSLDAGWLRMAAKELAPDAECSVLRAASAREWSFWEHQFYAFLAKQLPLSSEAAIDIAADETLHWSSRTRVLPWLRHTPGGDRNRRVAALTAALGHDRDFDGLMLRIAGLGFLGALPTLRSIETTERVAESKYANEKLGPSLIEAYLDSYIYHGDEFLGNYAIRYLQDTISSCQSMGRSLEYLNHRARIEGLRPGNAARLLTLADEIDCPSLMRAIMVQLRRRPNPHMTAQVANLARKREALAAHASNALAHIKTPKALAELEGLAAEGVTGAPAACALAWGYQQVAHRLGNLVKMASEAQDGICEWYAAWALGEIAQRPNDDAAVALDLASKREDNGLVRAVSLAALAKHGWLSSNRLRDGLELAEVFAERVVIGVSGAWLGDVDLFYEGLTAAHSNHAPFTRLEQHLANDALHALRSQPGGPWSLFSTLAELPHIT